MVFERLLVYSRIIIKAREKKMNDAKRKLIMEQYNLKPSDMCKDFVPREFLEKRFRDNND